jgi:hypothetical protein
VDAVDSAFVGALSEECSAIEKVNVGVSGAPPSLHQVLLELAAFLNQFELGGIMKLVRIVDFRDDEDGNVFVPGAKYIDERTERVADGFSRVGFVVEDDEPVWSKYSAETQRPENQCRMTVEALELSLA